jgi:hypothetical protein
VTLHDEESLKLRANQLFHLKSKTVGIRLTVGKESSYSLTRFCARLLPNTQYLCVCLGLLRRSG